MEIKLKSKKGIKPVTKGNTAKLFIQQSIVIEPEDNTEIDLGIEITIKKHSHIHIIKNRKVDKAHSFYAVIPELILDEKTNNAVITVCNPSSKQIVLKKGFHIATACLIEHQKKINR